jgi:hypothetical protein
MEEITGAWRNVHDEKLDNFQFSPHIISKLARMKWVTRVTNHVEVVIRRKRNPNAPIGN